MSRKCYKSDEAYNTAKVLERERYYKSLPQPGRRAWTDEEEEIVKGSASTTRELAVMLNRSVKSIEHKKAYIRAKEKQI